ncbi:unnamed protein product [Phytomonas sp. EM1]|nr:unnamed protein product [Phytomonas sp. EM1]|eukprot:CCW63785.1 unnamed protein product [Phytomonas sp. isolate EM1]
MQRVFQLPFGKKAVGEVEVFLRTMSSVERRWMKNITKCENKVRKFMMIEDQCRDRLRRNVLRGTHANLKYLVNTDLITTAQVAAPPPPETFLLYGIPSNQITAFSVYAISRLWADPDRVDLPLFTLIADFQSAWAILPPSKKAAYGQLAKIFREHEAHSLIAATGADTQHQEAKQIQKGRKKSLVNYPIPQNTVPCDSGSVNPKNPTGAKLSTSEEDAFKRFVKLSMQQMRAALGDKHFLIKEWEPIARVEWASKSVRQKQCYL